MTGETHLKGQYVSLSIPEIKLTVVCRHETAARPDIRSMALRMSASYLPVDPVVVSEETRVRLMISLRYLMQDALPAH